MKNEKRKNVIFYSLVALLIVMVIVFSFSFALWVHLITYANDGFISTNGFDAVIVDFGAFCVALVFSATIMFLLLSWFEKALFKNDWVSIDESFPIGMTWVLVDDGEYNIARYTKLGWNYKSDDNNRPIKRWKYLE